MVIDLFVRDYGFCFDCRSQATCSLRDPYLDTLEWVPTVSAETARADP